MPRYLKKDVVIQKYTELAMMMVSSIRALFFYSDYYLVTGFFVILY